MALRKKSESHTPAVDGIAISSLNRDFLSDTINRAIDPASGRDVGRRRSQGRSASPSTAWTIGRRAAFLANSDDSL